MPKAATMRSERIDIRTDAEVKAVIERAAQLRHTSISAYLLDSALEKAKAELRAVETITLRDADRDAFFAALAAPPEPNTALRKLFAEGRRRRA
ncbi:MAG TPA: DUF1778 domain-containing protein [Rectinemataceae bacterium]|nr:DUF1778 domain-containing protein [Rectinemataceae bacterium]